MRVARHAWGITFPLFVAFVSPAKAGDAQLAKGCETNGAPTRIVSLVPSATDLLLSLGEGHRLAARTTYDKDSSLARLPSVGGTIDPSVERLIAVRPDLVLIWGDSAAPGLRQRLRRSGLSVQVIHANTLADMRSTIHCLGAILSIQARADSLVRQIDAGLDSVRASNRERPRLKVFYLVWSRPLITTAGGTFIDSLIAVAGGQNIFSDLAAPWPTVALESVIAREPDVIVWPRHRSDRPETLADDPLWRAVRAARLGRVAIVDGNLMARPGPRVVAAARELSRLIHEAKRSP